MIKNQTFKLSHYLLILVGCLLFLLPLIHAWMIYPLAIEGRQTTYSALGGLIPQSDASGYYDGAQNFLEEGKLNAWNTRRPLNAILLAMRLWLSNNNFQTALILQAVLCGLSCLLVAFSIAKVFGKIAGLTTFLILFLFAATFIPTTLSETLGLTLGSLGFVFLWHGIQRPSYNQLGWGTLLLTIGLNARAGAFLILPLLFLWIGIALRKNSMRYAFAWRPALTVLLGIFTGFIFSTLLTLLYCAKTGGAAHSNFALTLFGLVAGGKSWAYAYTLFPDLPSLSEAAAAQFLYRQSFELFLENPLLLLSGYLKGVLGLIKGLISFFQSRLPEHFLLKACIRFLGTLLVCLGLYHLKRLYTLYRKETGLICTGLLGMLLSAGIIWTDGGFRVFATTLPFFAAAIGIVFASFFNSQKTGLNGSLQSHSLLTKTSEVKLASYLAILLLTLGLIGPLLINKLPTAFSSPSPIAKTSFSCAPHETAIRVKTIAGAPHLTLVPPAALFKNSIVRSIVEDKQPFLRILEADILDKPSTLSLIYDLNTHQSKYILAMPQLFSTPQKQVQLCGVPIPGAESIMLIKSFEVIRE